MTACGGLMRRLGAPLRRALSEVVATFGLIATILGCWRVRFEIIPVAVALYVVSGYWFTASTCFANPAVTIARSLTDTFSGIRPVDAPWFILAEIAGALLAAALFHWFFLGKKLPEGGRSAD